jgi:hypothetical protein
MAADAEVLRLVQEHNKPFNAGENLKRSRVRVGSRAVGSVSARRRSAASTLARAARCLVLSVLRRFRRPLAPKPTPTLPPPPPVNIGDYLAVKGIKKAAVQRALDSLAAAGKLTAKVRRGLLTAVRCLALHAHACIYACMQVQTSGTGVTPCRIQPRHATAAHAPHAPHLPPRQNTKPQEFGKTKIYLPPQDGLEVLSKDELDAKKAELKAVQQQLADERAALREAEEGGGFGFSEWGRVCEGRACEGRGIGFVSLFLKGLLLTHTTQSSLHCPPPPPRTRPELRSWTSSLTAEQLQQQVDELASQVRRRALRLPAPPFSINVQSAV